MSKKDAMFSISHSGDIITVKSLKSDDTISFNPFEFPEAQKNAALLEGAKNFVRTAYNTSAGTFDDIKKRIDGLKAGTWLPGSRSSVKEPDDLARAVMETTKISLADYEGKFLANWLMPGRLKYPDGVAVVTKTTTRDGKERLVGKEKALRMLRERSEIAPLLAKYAADRARASRQPKDTPQLDLTSFASPTGESDEPRPAEAAE